MSFFHKINVTKCLGHHYAIWTSDSNFLLAPKKAGPHFRYCNMTYQLSFIINLLMTTKEKEFYE